MISEDTRYQMERNAKGRDCYGVLKRVSSKYDREGMRILDIGIHGDIKPGGHAFLFRKAIYNTLDIDETMEPSFVGDIRELSLDDEMFDMIICVAVIEHVLDNREKALSELYRILKPGGTLVFNWPKSMARESEPAKMVDLKQMVNFYNRSILFNHNDDSYSMEVVK
jgi:SAM-dependent methyltransferase